MGRERQNLVGLHGAVVKAPASAGLGRGGQAQSLPRGSRFGAERPGQQPARKHGLPSTETARRTRGRGAHMARWGEKESGGSRGHQARGGVWEGDPRGTLTQAQAWCTAGFRMELEKAMARKREKEEQERKTTPELPDQVIAVRCQSAAERGVGRERRDMRRIRAVSDRERTSVSQESNSPLLFVAASGPLAGPKPSPGPTPLPHCTAVPAATLTGRRAPAWHTRVPSVGDSPGLGERVRAQAGEEPKPARVHTASHGRAWLWAPGWVLVPEATELWLRTMGWGACRAVLLP